MKNDYEAKKWGNKKEKVTKEIQTKELWKINKKWGTFLES